MLNLRPDPALLVAAARAALASAICLLAGWSVGNLAAGLMANLGAFAVLYGSGRPYRNRAWLLGVIGCALVLSVCVGVGASVATSPWINIVAAALIAAVASFICTALNVESPGAYLFMIAAAAGTSMHGQETQLVQVAGLVAAGAVVAWILHMVGAFWHPRAPEHQAVANAAAAVAAFIDSTGHAQTDLLRHKAATSLQEAWKVLIAWQPAHLRADAELAQLQTWSRELHGLFAAAVREHSAGRSLGPDASARARNVKSRVAELPSDENFARSNERQLFFRARDMMATSFAWAEQPPRIAFRVGAAALIAGYAGMLTGLERSYWAAAAAVLILHQGFNWVRAMQRGLERTLGTCLGLIFAFVLASLGPTGLVLIACIALLQFAGQLFSRSNYVAAVFFFTPMALLMATASRPDTSHVGELIVARGLDTMIGCAVGLAVLLVTYRADRASAREAVSLTLDAARSVLPFLSRQEVTTTEARLARRRLRSSVFGLTQLYQEQAAGTKRAREEADRMWPAIVATHRLAFRILAACWEIEAAGEGGSGRAALFEGEAEQVIGRALQSLQAGRTAVVPNSGSNFLVTEITMLNECYAEG